MEKLKDRILNLPAWKAGICILLVTFFLGSLVEFIASHTIFCVFDHMILKFEKMNNDDINDMNNMGN